MNEVAGSVDQPIRVFILGSCVSRDAFSLPHPGFELAGYIARTSLASAFQQLPAPDSMLSAAKGIESRFQRRMVELDLTKRAAPVLREANFDVLLLDLIDERFSLARFGGSPARPRVVTLSAEFSRACQWNGPRVPLGSAQHSVAWRDGVQRLFKVVPREKIVVNRALWAARFEDGSPVPNQEVIAATNAHLQDMYGYLKKCGVRGVIDYPAGFTADSGHYWGPAPFHYAEPVYRRMLDELGRMATRSRSDGADATVLAGAGDP